MNDNYFSSLLFVCCLAQSYKCYWDDPFCNGPYFYTDTFDECCEADGRSWYGPWSPGQPSRCHSENYVS